MTQMSLAAEMGVSVQTVQNWELGRKFPSMKRLPELAEALRIPISSLFLSETRSKVVREGKSQADLIEARLQRLEQLAGTLLDEVHALRHTVVSV